MAKGETASNSDQAARWVHNRPFNGSGSNGNLQAGGRAKNLLTGDAQVLRHCGSTQPFI